LQPTKTMSLSK